MVRHNQSCGATHVKRLTMMACAAVFLIAVSNNTWSADTYSYVSSIGSYGSDDGQFIQPIGVAIDSSGYIYVSDTYNYRVQRFSYGGTYQIQWGSSGSDSGEFSLAQGIAVDTSGYVYVSDTGNHRIQKCGSSGFVVHKSG